MIPVGLAEEAVTYGTELAALDLKPSTVQFRIDDLTYTSSKLATSIGLGVWMRLTSLFGSTQVKRIAESSGLDLGALAVSFAQQAMQDGLVPLCSDLLGRMQCGALRVPGAANESGPVMPVFDDHFAGEYVHLIKVCAFAVAHNLRGPTLGSR